MYRVDYCLKHFKLVFNFYPYFERFVEQKVEFPSDVNDAQWTWQEKTPSPRLRDSFLGAELLYESLCL